MNQQQKSGRQTALDTQSIEAIREQAYRAGYGAGGDAVQLEQRRRPFLIEDEAWCAFRGRR